MSIVANIAERGFPIMGKATSYNDRKKFGAAGGDWNKEKRRWYAKDIVSLDALLLQGWLPEGLVNVRQGKDLADVLRTKAEEASKRDAAARARPKVALTLEQRAFSAKKELGIQDDDPVLVKELYDKYKITPEQIQRSDTVAHFGPMIMSAERLKRALRLNLTTPEAIHAGDWNFNPSDPISKRVKRH